MFGLNLNFECFVDLFSRIYAALERLSKYFERISLQKASE